MRLPPLLLSSLLVTGMLTTPATAAGAPPRFVQDHADLLRAGAGQEFTVASTTTGPDGTSYVRMDRTYRGSPVLGGDVVVRRGAGDKVLGATVTLAAPLTLSTTPQVGAATAGRIAADSAGQLTGKQVGTPSLVVEALGDTAATRVPTLAWDVPVNGSHPDGLPSKLHVLVDAVNGNVTAQYDDVQADTGHGLRNGDVPLTTMASDSSPSVRVMQDPPATTSSRTTRRPSTRSPAATTTGATARATPTGTPPATA